MKDKIYSQKLEHISGFEFNEQVVEVFDDMISRSVPLYEEVQEATAEICKKLAQKNSSIYDLGSSKGTTLIKIAKRLENKNILLVGVDNSEPMVKSCKEILAKQGVQARLICEDIAKTETKNASIVILNYTLQFIEPKKRQKVLSRIYQNLLPGGAIILTEKVKHENEEIDKLTIGLHHDFKKRNGYSEIEIAQKRDAIENKLIPKTTEQNIALLKSAGFNNIEVVLKWYNFVSLIALKE